LTAGKIPDAKGDTAATPATPAPPQDYTNMRGDFERRNAARGTTFATGASLPGAVGIVALDEIAKLEGQNSEEAVAIRKDLDEAVRLIHKMETGLIGTTFDDKVDRSVAKGLTRKELDRLDEIILEMKKHGIELVD
jgi:hypothetical protein